MKIINLTTHDTHWIRNGKVATLKPSGDVAYVDENGKIQGLPEPQDGIIYTVSKAVNDVLGYREDVGASWDEMGVTIFETWEVEAWEDEEEGEKYMRQKETEREMKKNSSFDTFRLSSTFFDNSLFSFLKKCLTDGGLTEKEAEKELPKCINQINKLYYDSFERGNQNDYEISRFNNANERT